MDCDECIVAALRNHCNNANNYQLIITVQFLCETTYGIEGKC